ncbi:NAD(P)/FAD-dependent oxidoreductase [Mycobacterium sp. pUA109]|uniref:NAD(P)/FAD-dependent oxidoreductase n=1 Tax=Mycobacterium sp. pUA109 TaxID=3238982 RepID=UPI00351B0AB6
MDDFDVVIVGARCAGSPLAITLARHGLRVCLLDKAHFPSETPSTHVIQPCGVHILDDLGVLEAVRATGAVPLYRVTLVNDDVRIDAKTRSPGLCVRRVTLDALLVDAAAQAGADVRTGCRMTGLTRDAAGRVSGVRTDRGTVSARLVVGADGCHSTVATATGAAEYLATPAGRIFAWAYFDGVADLDGRLRLGRRGDQGFLACPTDGGLYMAAVAIDRAHRDDFQANRDRHFSDGLAKWPELADLLSGATRVGPLRAISNWHGYFRQSAGPGWVLVGDAGHFKDPAPGQGISDALRQVQQLSESIASGFASGGSLDLQLQQWWQWRDQDANEMYWFAHDMDAPGVSTPLVTRMLRDIAADATATQQLLDVLNHDLRPSQLLTTGRMVKAAARALRDRPDLIRATLREIASAVNDEVYRSRHRRPPVAVSGRW